MPLAGFVVATVAVRVPPRYDELVKATWFFLFLLGCAHNVRQDKATGDDGRPKGAKVIELEQGQGQSKGVVTYPGGDRIDWRKVELPPGVGQLLVSLAWRSPRPGLALGFDVFDEWGTRVGGAKGSRARTLTKRKEITIDNAYGTYLIRVYAVGRGDAGAYQLKVGFSDVGAGYDFTGLEIPEPPRLAAVPEPALPCDEYSFDRKNPACREICPNPPDPGWPACSGKCPNPPDANIPACHATMPCPMPPDRRIKACPKSAWPACAPDNIDPQNPNCDNYRPAPVTAKIIDITAASDGATITINRGEDKGIQPGWRGRIVKSPGKAVAGGEFRVIKVTKRECVGKVKLTVDTIGANRNVELEAP